MNLVSDADLCLVHGGGSTEQPNHVADRKARRSAPVRQDSFFTSRSLVNLSGLSVADPTPVTTDSNINGYLISTPTSTQPSTQSPTPSSSLLTPVESETGVERDPSSKRQCCCNMSAATHVVFAFNNLFDA